MDEAEYDTNNLIEPLIESRSHIAVRYKREYFEIHSREDARALRATLNARGIYPSVRDEGIRLGMERLLTDAANFTWPKQRIHHKIDEDLAIDVCMAWMQEIMPGLADYTVEFTPQTNGYVFADLKKKVTATPPLPTTCSSDCFPA